MGCDGMNIQDIVFIIICLAIALVAIFATYRDYKICRWALGGTWIEVDNSCMRSTYWVRPGKINMYQHEKCREVYPVRAWTL